MVCLCLDQMLDDALHSFLYEVAYISAIFLFSGPGVSRRLDEVQECDVIDHLMSVIPGEERSHARVIIQHGDVRVLVVKRDVGVLVR